MDDHAEEEDVDVLQGFGREEVVVLEGKTGRDCGGEGCWVWPRGVDCVGEVLDDELQMGKGVGEGDAGVAVGAAKLHCRISGQ